MLGSAPEKGSAWLPFYRTSSALLTTELWSGRKQTDDAYGATMTSNV